MPEMYPHAGEKSERFGHIMVTSETVENEKTL
jgi:hypothetical protein